MILCHISDLHIDERKGDNGEGLDEQVDRLIWCGVDADRHGADLIVVAGDVFEHVSSPAERNAAIRVFTSWAEHSPVVGVYGNHDRPGDLDFLTKIRTRNPVEIYARPHSDIWCTDKLEVDIALLPWPRKSMLAGKLDSSLDIDHAAIEAMRVILLGFARGWTGNKPRVLVGHVELGAAIMDSGQPIAGKCEIEFSESDLLSTGADYVALGHIHKHQVICDGRICYGGATRQCTFGEDDMKGYCLVDVEREKPPVIEHRRAPGRGLHTIEAAWPIEASPAGHVGMLVSDGDVPIEQEPIMAGDIYRLQYAVAESNKTAAAEQASRAMAAWLEAGAHAVKLDPKVIPTTRMRSQEIVTARTTVEKLHALHESRKSVPLRINQIESKLAKLEEAVSS